MDNICMVAGSVYHLLVIIQLLTSKTNPIQGKPDIILMDTMNDVDGIVYRLQKLKLCAGVYVANVSRIPQFQNLMQTTKNKSLRTIKWAIFQIRRKRGFRRCFHFEKKYNVFYTPILSDFFNTLFEMNSTANAVIRIFEDGITTYFTYERIYHLLFNPTYPLQLFYTLIRKRNVTKSIDKVLVFCPELVLWEMPKKIEKIEPIDPADNDYISCINKLFDYEPDPAFDASVIFFEGAYAADSSEKPDMDFIQQLSKIIPKDQIVIKQHPRNSTNRFDELRVMTSRNIAIPWEVIVLNIDIQNKILVTINSSSVCTPFLLLGMHYHAVILASCTEIKQEKSATQRTTDELFKKAKKYIYERSTDVFYFPDSIPKAVELVADLYQHNMNM